MYNVREYVRMRLCVCVRRQPAMHLSICRYECSYAFGMRAGIRASVCLHALARVHPFVCMCVSIYACACVRLCVCIYVCPLLFF